MLYLSKKSAFIVFVLILGLFSCKKKDNPQPENQLEGINKLTMTFSPAGGGSPLLFSISDADGPGGNPPVTVVPVLAKNIVYTVTIKTFVINNGVESDDTQEISNEGTAHQFFFQTSGGLAATFAYADTDSNGKPIGLISTCNSGSSASSGSLKVILKHQLDKFAAGISISNVGNAGGDTDIEATFGNVSVQ